MVFLGRFLTLEAAMDAIIEDGFYQVERDADGAWLIYDAPEDPIGDPIGDTMPELDN